VAILRANLSIVAISRTVGNAEKSNGFFIHRQTKRISTDKAIDEASPKSIKIDGSGRKRIVRISKMPTENHALPLDS
jgi:hypothetical protein